MTTTTIPPMPALEIDRQLAALSAGRRPSAQRRADRQVERQIVWALLHCLQDAHPGRGIVVFDGEERVACADPKAAMEIVFNLDTAWVCLGRSWVCLITGNGADIISDCGANPATEAAIDAAKAACGMA